MNRKQFAPALAVGPATQNGDGLLVEDHPLGSIPHGQNYFRSEKK